MLVTNIFIIISIISSVVTINETIPKTPSHFIPHTKLLPEQGDNVNTDLSFQHYFPIACFCDRPTCNANVRSVESPVVELLTRDGKTVKSLEITVQKGELMYIVLVDARSSFASGTYLQRTSYWRLSDGQHEILPKVPLDLEIHREVSVSVMKEKSPQFPFDMKMKGIAVTALEMSTSLTISPVEGSVRKTTYHFSESKSNQMVGVYQLLHEFVIYASISMRKYVQSQNTGAQCTSYLIFKEKCGFLQLLPSFIQRTPTFRQAAVSLETKASKTTSSTDKSSGDTESLKTTTGKNKKSKKKSLSRKAIMIILSASIASALLATLVAVFLFCHPFRRSSASHTLLPADDLDDDHELQERLEGKTDQVLSNI